MISIKHKIGDSIQWSITAKNSDGSVVDLTGFSVNVDAYPENGRTPLFSIDSRTSVAGNSVTIPVPASGVVEIAIKNTDGFREGEYYCDVQYVDADGYKSSSNNFRLKVVRWM
jgi:hypothetical protein